MCLYIWYVSSSGMCSYTWHLNVVCGNGLLYVVCEIRYVSYGMFKIIHMIWSVGYAWYGMCHTHCMFLCGVANMLSTVWYVLCEILHVLCGMSNTLRAVLYTYVHVYVCVCVCVLHSEWGIRYSIWYVLCHIFQEWDPLEERSILEVLCKHVMFPFLLLTSWNGSDWRTVRNLTNRQLKEII